MEQEEDDHENYQRDGKLRDVGDDHGDGKAIEKTPEKSDEEELEERIKQKQLQGDFTYEWRVKDTHLSQEQCVEFLLNNMGENSEYVFMHQHVEK